MVAEIENRLFMGDMDKNGKNPRCCIDHLDQNYFRCIYVSHTMLNTLKNTSATNHYHCNFLIFRCAGEILAAIIAQGGPLPNFMREWCYRYLCSQDPDIIQVSVSDVTDPELSQLIMEVRW